MFSKIIKLSTSIWIDNNRKQVTFLKFLITVSLTLCFICEIKYDNETPFRAPFHLQSRLSSPLYQGQSQGYRNWFAERGWGRHWPQSIMWVTQWSPLAYTQFRYQANPDMTTWRLIIYNLRCQPMGKGSWPPHPS